MGPLLPRGAGPGGASVRALPLPWRRVSLVAPVGVEAPRPARRGRDLAGPQTGRVTGWGVVVPVKLLALAKTRLQAYGDAGRAELALAFAADVVAAAVRAATVDRVLVVSDDPRAAGLARTGVQVVPDEPSAGLNPALAHGAGLLGRSGRGVAALSADLPALRADDLAAALGAAQALGGRAYVPDAAGTGTTLLAAAPGTDLAPAFGPASRARHRAQGAAELDGAPSLRRDVDTPADLEQARALGVGPVTAAVLARLA